jgi:hypothetical protein
MPADSEKAMFHAGSRFSRRWANYGAMFRLEPKALACVPSSPLPHLLPATCDGKQVGEQAWFQLESCLRPTRPRQSPSWLPMRLVIDCPTQQQIYLRLWPADSGY